MILCVGDSFTYGDELDDRNHAWPSVLDSMMDTAVVRVARPGATNSWIAHKVVQKSIELNPDTVIVAWSNSDRYDLFPNDSHLSECYNIDDSSIPFVKQLYSEYHNSTGKFIEWIFQAILVQNFLENHNIQYLFANAFGVTDIIEQNNGNPYFKEVMSYLNTEYFVGWPDEDFITWSEGMPRGPKGHFLEQGHQIVAEKLHSHLEDML
jgi:hypothetical protein